MKKRILGLLLLSVCAFYGCSPTRYPVASGVKSTSAADRLNLDRLPDSDIQKVQALLVKLEPLMTERRAKQNLATLTFLELYTPLNPEQRQLLKRFENLEPGPLNVKIPYRGLATGKEELVLLKGQKVTEKGKEREIPPQFVPPEVFKAYTAMMAAMQKDLGRRLYVESGYRSSAYQLYLLVYYLKNHQYSIRQTAKFVALPGYSEHGSPQHQALDFINRDGINGEDNPKEFEDLPEFRWLVKNAKKFDFVLSYPRGSKEGITYEPWHWRYEKSAALKSK
jgi:LAS superfamily LD-carboxypeptidase LdcB